MKYLMIVATLMVSLISGPTAAQNLPNWFSTKDTDTVIPWNTARGVHQDWILQIKRGGADFFISRGGKCRKQNTPKVSGNFLFNRGAEFGHDFRLPKEYQRNRITLRKAGITVRPGKCSGKGQPLIVWVVRAAKNAPIGQFKWVMAGQPITISVVE